LNFDLFRDIIFQAKPLGLSSVKLTGGEPFIHPDIIRILDFLHGENVHVNIETNGVYCPKRLVDTIAKGNMPFVSISLDGADANTHEWIRGVEGCFEQSLLGIRRLVEAGVVPQIIMTVMKKNKYQLKQVVEIAQSLGCGSVKFNIVQPTSRGLKMKEYGETLSISEILELGKYVENILAASTHLHLFFDYPHAFRLLSHMFGQNRSGCGNCGMPGVLGVLADGSYALCGIGENLPELVFGQAATDSLEYTWNQNPILNELRNGLPGKLTGICSKCLMKTICRGSCIAQNYYRRNDLWAPFWFCEEAYNAGLFPKSRLISSLKK
jgi:SynChlorMet cassette radical SAM/SPASM protein ScmF